MVENMIGDGKKKLSMKMNNGKWTKLKTHVQDGYGSQDQQNEDRAPKFLDVLKNQVQKRVESLAENVKVRKAVEHEKMALNRKLKRFNVRQEVS